MRIALVAPSPNPFVVGGAENLWWGMIDYLARETRHQADLVKLPVKESTLPDLVGAYEAFSRLDLSGYDAVISTKYPAWMVAHDNHTVYLQHRCRGFYDWYPGGGPASDAYTGRHKGILELLEFIERSGERREALAEFFLRFRALASDPAAGPELARHPGPLGRAIIRFLDGVGLARGRIRRYATIAEAVKRREGYFPKGAQVQVVYHPTNKTGFRNEAEDYFFTVSRFYPSKRIDLLIDAYRLTKIPLPFKIAGTGQLEAELRARAAGDPRIEFVGFVRDDELVDLYARALAVPFVPADEDFGYITLEAMLSGKAVITTNDSGGPLELVRDGETGIVAEPDPASLAAAFERIYAAGDWRRALANRGRKRAESITWKGVFDTLLGTDSRSSSGEGRGKGPRLPRARPRLTVLNPYAVHPPANGGAYRIHWLYRTLSRHIDVDLVTLVRYHDEGGTLWLDEGFREIRVPRTLEHEKADAAAQEEAGAPVFDITALENIELTPEYGAVLRRSLARSQLVSLAHPYMLTALREAGYAGPFIHESQNCELALKRRMLKPSKRSEKLLALVEEAEGRCCREAAFVYAVSDEDIGLLRAAYVDASADMILVPNGTDTRGIAYFDAARRRKLRRRLGLAAERPLVLFLASGHGPNLEAAEKVLEVARRSPQLLFAFVGNVVYEYRHRRVPDNVWLVGSVPEEERNVFLQACDVALNPMLFGGGTNLKLLDYFAAGAPVVSTEIGIRGTGARDGVHVIVASADGIAAGIARMRDSRAALDAMTLQARALVEQRFDWWKLGESLHQAIVDRGLLPRS